MPAWPIALPLLAPLVLLAVFVAARGAEGPRWALPLASLPALLLAAWPDAELALPELLLGVRLRVDGLARPMLLLVGLAWSAAGWFAASRLEQRFRIFAMFWLATLAGTLVATLAGDLATFYTGYVVMTFAAYGLVLHERSPAALHAAKVYLVLALVGEALLL
jgi:formate hydrogenlyase subunit 3/multisubunit Na+/H+ antiporter MnhD subunit